ncbi:uncharacterized protein CDAR_430881 [Caerostris darwini]|uniref:Uncharacterized protein n=1 Tax=Caerostris darwini TaxID=1538125 RepID=A0AAV4RMN2_9ARAC|nr:uncharacterized protein CDAR_430881 [Caerostris darwini]
MEDIKQPRVIEESFYNSNLKTAGTFTAGGFGSYMKSSMHSQNSVDILIKVSFRTISESLPFSIKPIAQWKTLGKAYLGTHYVQSIIYGGDLIACIRFKAMNSEDLNEIRGVIKTSISAGNVLDLVGEGKLESLDRQLKRKATMEVNYFATVPLEGVPNNIQGLRDLVRNFKDHVKKVNNGIGVPVEVELVELSNYDREFEYLKNKELETELENFEMCYDDLLSTKSRIQGVIFENLDTITKEEEKKLAGINDRVRKILNVFSETIANMDLEKGSTQLDPATKAYKEGKIGMAGKFRRELNKIVRKIGSSKSYR